MGRLAVDQHFKGLGLGLGSACQTEIAAFALVVDARDESAVGFYRHHGFIALTATPITLFLPAYIKHTLARVIQTIPNANAE